ncbi:kinase-like protein, partial [Polyplosphaeria fusca]
CVRSRLEKEVEKALVWSQFDNEEYLPLDSFESIFNIKSIALLLDETYDLATDEELQEKFASIVDRKSGRSRRRILGVLVLMSRVAHIEYFFRKDIWDDQLPLERLPGSSMGCVRTRSSENYNLMKDWSRNDSTLFYSFQKIFFIPFFDIQENRLCSYELESNIRLPWKSVINPVFALKAIEAGDHKAYKDELSALEKTCAQVQKEKHLIKLLLTFRHGEKFYLLFEWADGNLDEFWKTRSFRPPRERWAAEQCLGLAKAVRRIHGLTTWQKRERSSSVGSLIEAERDWGRHGDIKPENILWFQEYGNDRNLLVVSDLGLTRYHSQFSKSFVPRSHIDGCSWAYRPPELDMNEGISQKYDIWSLGCVFLEFCVWYLQGYDEVERFSLQR